MGQPDQDLPAPAQQADHAAAPEAEAASLATPSDAASANDGPFGGAAPEIDANAVAAMQGLGGDGIVSADLPSDLGLSGDHDLLAALHGLDHVGNIDHALDQLTSSADLFDLPALDFGDHHAADS